MKELTQYYNKNGVLFKAFKEVSPKELNSRKKIKIFVATSIKGEYYALFVYDSKSRFIRKNAEELFILEEKLSSYMQHNFKKKELLIQTALCSKAKKFLEDNKWRVRVDFM
ncbi:hypothetical protein CRV08_05500 [Halarcobacter ebronensis]|uniref:Uncharacterized protein n=1 Tax=Halarcobacter ebronensis TaxID=1462615 RepID=A0A4Q0YEL4_9BACT|nr:hypothetical protein [Halarcobacter ebronensis]QKF80989.1 hypothetical protein AEBR_0480 [Halarcobacter ebronensis]RXJ68892.1 hypothetical protein CRV08_05500 [Halarcobacter ebronensis]RXK06303.1 hypothetical protein CRV07_06290 [Halarcobacter ebronensis]